MNIPAPSAIHIVTTIVKESNVYGVRLAQSSPSIKNAQIITIAAKIHNMHFGFMAF